MTWHFELINGFFSRFNDIPTLTPFSDAALTLTKKECVQIMWPLLKSYLPKSGLNWHFPLDILYGQVDKHGVVLDLKKIIARYLSYCWCNQSDVAWLANRCINQTITGTPTNGIRSLCETFSSIVTMNNLLIVVRDN